jgi:hypothetical protein
MDYDGSTNKIRKEATGVQDAQKKAAVLAMIATGKKGREISLETGVPTSTISRWKREKEFFDPDFAMGLEKVKREAVEESWTIYRRSMALLLDKVAAAKTVEEARASLLRAIDGDDSGEYDYQKARLGQIVDSGAGMSTTDTIGVIKLLRDQQEALTPAAAGGGDGKLRVELDASLEEFAG